MTNAEAWLSIALRPRKPEGSLGRTDQDGHLNSHTAPELSCEGDRWLCVCIESYNKRSCVCVEQSKLCVCVCVHRTKEVVYVSKCVWFKGVYSLNDKKTRFSKVLPNQPARVHAPLCMFCYF